MSFISSLGNVAGGAGAGAGAAGGTAAAAAPAAAQAGVGAGTVLAPSAASQSALTAAPSTQVGAGTVLAPTAAETVSSLPQTAGGSSSASLASGAGAGSGNPGILGGLFGKSPGSGAPPPAVGSVGQEVAGVSGGAPPVTGKTVKAPKPAQQSGFLGLAKRDRDALFSQAMIQLAMPRGGSAQSEAPQVGSLHEIAAQLGGIPQMQQGGTIPPGGQAIVGEGGAPEIATNTPQGTVITPLEAGTAFPTAQAAQQPTQQPAERSLIGKVGEGLQDTLILGAALQNPQMFLSMRQAGIEASRRTAEAAIKYPEVLKISPGATAAVDAMLGEGSAQAILDESDPNTFNQLVATAFDAQIFPEGTIVNPGEAPKGPATAQLIDHLRNRGIGAKLDDRGRVIPTFPARTHAEASNVAAYTSFTESWNALTAAGIDSTSAAQMAARGTMAKMAEVNLTPSKEIVDLATATEQSEIEAARARLIKRAQLDEQIAAEERLAQRRASGRVHGETSAKVDLARRMVTVKVPLGTDSETGEAVSSEVDVPQLNFAEMTKPINDPGTLTKFIMPDGSRPTAGVTPLELMAKNAVAVDPVQMKATLEQSAAIQMLGELKDLRANIFTTNDVMSRAGMAGQLYAASFQLSSDETAIGAQTQIAAILGRMGTFARALGGERSAVLSDRDIQRMIGAFSVGYAESATSLDTKIRIIEESMASVSNRLLSGDRKLLALFRSEGKNPQQLADWLGIGDQFRQTQKAQGADGQAVAPKAPPRLQKRADALAREVNAGRMTREQAAAQLRKSRAVMR